MTPTLASRLAAALGDSPLAATWRETAAPFLEHRGGEPAAGWDGGVVRGLARVLATSVEAAGFLARRSALLERLADLDAGYLERRAQELGKEADQAQDLEGLLDALRLLRREETLLATCLDLGDLVDFEQVSVFLSHLAESILRTALLAAREALATGAGAPPLAVVGMGKIGGREFTYESDLDLVFLHEGGTEDVGRAARLAQRLISYLSTMTGAGIAYRVDARLRPSGQQGTLVTSLDAFERYQRGQARTWEHLVLMRARVLAGDAPQAPAVLERTRAAVIARHGNPWPEIAAMRGRVERERVSPDPDLVDYKTGPGGLMDVDFLAAGAALEQGGAPFPAIPSVPALLRHAAGPEVERVLAGYRFLRRLEARARWVAGRPVESLRRSDPSFARLAELMEPGVGADTLVRRIADARVVIRAAFDAVTEAGSVAVLGGRGA